jgi:cyclase
MHRPRIIPVLLLKNQGLVKTIGFKDPRYIGDPIHAVRIFNDLKADELVFLDIDATRSGRTINPDFVKIIGEEADMPFAVGGGIRSLETIQRLIASGAEKVVINSAAVEQPYFVREAAREYGSSTISVCIDVKKKWLGRVQIWSNAGTRSLKISPQEFARQMEDMGAGELIVQSIERDGSMLGYDLELIRSISEQVSIPVVALGGAGSVNDLKLGYEEGFASGVAAGSIFVYQGTKRGVLINYPDERF